MAKGYRKTLGVGWREALELADTFLTRTLAAKLARRKTSAAYNPTTTHVSPSLKED